MRRPPELFNALAGTSGIFGLVASRFIHGTSGIILFWVSAILLIVGVHLEIIERFKFKFKKIIVPFIVFILIIIYFSQNYKIQLYHKTIQSPENSLHPTVKSDTIKNHKQPKLDPTRKIEVPNKPISANQEYYDIHPENMRGGTIIGKNTAPIFQNPQVTIDNTGMSVDTNAVLQNGIIVAKAFTPIFFPKDSTIKFMRIYHDGSFNEALDFQYRGIIFHIKSRGAIGEVVVGGPTHYTIYDARCDYSGTINGVTR